MALGLLPAALCCVTAYLDVSVAGAAYLAAFLAWGAIISRQSAHSQARRLWRTVTAGSAALFVARIFTQVFYSVLGMDGSSSGLHNNLASLLNLLGLGSPRPPPGEMLLLLGAPLITGLAAASISTSSRSSHRTGARSGPAHPASRTARAPATVLYSSGSPGAAASRTYNTQRSLPSTSNRPPAAQAADDQEYALRTAASMDDLPVEAAAKPAAKGFWGRKKHQHHRTASNMSFTGDEADAWTFMTRGTPSESPAAQSATPPAPSEPIILSAGRHDIGSPGAAAAHGAPGTQPPAVTANPPGTSELSSFTLLLATCLAAILWPGALNTVYIAAVIVKAAQWSRASRDAVDSWRPSLVHTLQGYVGVHCVLLYGSQPLLQQGDPDSVLHKLSNVLGLYSLSARDEFTDNTSKGLQASHLLAVYVLYVACGWYLGSLLSLNRQPKPAQPVAGRGGDDDGVTSPTVAQVPGWQRLKGRVHGGLAAALHGLNTSYQHGTITQLGPHTLSMAICVTSMIQVTLLSGVMLLLGLVTLVMPQRWLRYMLRPLSPRLVVFFSAWLAALFAASSVRPPLELQLPPVLHSIGLPVGLPAPHAVALLASTILLLICAASLAHHLNYPDTQEPASTDVHVAVSPSSTSPAAYLPLPPVGIATVTATIPMTVTSTATSPTVTTAIPGLLLIWYTCCALEPVAWLLLGLGYQDVLHAVYLLHFTISVTRACLSQYAYSRSRGKYKRSKSSLFIRMFACLHLVILYAIMVAKLPGFATLQSDEPSVSKRTLQLLGLEDPQVLRDCVPLLGALALSTLHAALAKQRAQLLQQQPDPDGDFAHQGWLLPVTAWLEGATVSLGHIVLGLAVLLLACTSLGVGFGLLGLGYLTGAVLLLALPPSKESYLPRASRASLAGHTPHSSPGAVSDLEQPLLQPARHARRPTQRCDAGSWVLVLLVFWSAIDLTARLAVMLVLLVTPDSITPQVQELLSDLLGIKMGADQDASLLATATTPAVTLLLLQAFRWWLAAAALHTTEPSLMKALKQQYTWSWLLKRAVILHVDHVGVLLAFGLALQVPSMLGSSLVTCLSILILLASWSSPGSTTHNGSTPRDAGTTTRSSLRTVAVVLSHVFTSAWIAAQYLVQVPWISTHIIGITPDHPDPTCVSLLLHWLGIATSTQSQPDLNDSPALLMIALLGLLAMSSKAVDWYDKLPAVVITVAPPGQACCLFWPPSSRQLIARYKSECLLGSEPLSATHMNLIVPPGGPTTYDRFDLYDVSLARECHEDARAELLGYLTATTRPLRAVFELLVASPLRQLLSVLFSRLKEGTHTVMDVMDIPHTPHTARGSHALIPEGGFSTLEGHVSRSHSPGLSEPRPHCQHDAPAAPGAGGSAVGGGSGAARPPAAPQHEGKDRDTSPGALARRTAQPASVSCTAVSHKAADSAHDQLLGLPQVVPAIKVGPSRAWAAGGAASTGGVGYAAPAGADGGGKMVPGRSAATMWATHDAAPDKPYLSLLLLSARDLLDHWLGNWGLDINLGLMLLSAFALSNMLSGLYVAAVVLGTMNPTAVTRVRCWRYLLLPCQAIILAYQYLSWVGWWELLPPLTDPACAAPGGDGGGDDDRHGAARRVTSHWTASPWISWLGVGPPDTSAMWLLLFTLGATSMQAIRDAAVASCGGAPTHVQGSAPAGTSNTSNNNNNSSNKSTALGISSSDPEAPPATTLTETAWAVGAQQLNTPASFPVPPQGAVGVMGASPGQFTVGNSGSGYGAAMKRTAPRILGPFLYSERHKWSTLDWLFFFTLKYSFDALLVCVVLVCTVQRDLVHAGYLALALLLFRKRGQLQQAAVKSAVHAATPAPGAAPSTSSGQVLAQGVMLAGTPFWMLPTFNLMVLVLQLVYQAPFHTLIGNAWDNACHAIPTWGPLLRLPATSSMPFTASDPTSSTCTMPQLLGLCKLHPSSSGSGPAPGPSASTVSALWALLTTEAVADVVLWLLLRLHAKLLTSAAYQQVMSCVLHQQARIRAARRQWERDSTEAQAHAALASGLQQVIRAQRVAKLKTLFCEPVDGSGQHGPALFESLNTVAGLAEVLDSDLPLDTTTLRLKTPDAPPLVPQSLLRPSSSAQQIHDIHKTRSADTGRHTPPLPPPPPPPPAGPGAAGVGAGQMGSGMATGMPPAGSQSGTSQLRPSRSHDSSLGTYELVSPDEQHLPGSGGYTPPELLTPTREQQPLQQQPPQHTVTTIYRPQAHEADAPGPAAVSVAEQGPFAAPGFGAGVGPAAGGAASSGVQAVGGPEGKEAPQHQDGPPPAGWRTSARATRAGSDTEFFPLWLTTAPDGHVAPLRPRAPRVERRSWIHRAWVFLQTQQYRGRNKWIVCSSFLLVLATDWSILALAPPLSLVLYTLLAHHPKPAYWQASLVYAEALLVLQYTYLSLTSCMCSTGSSSGGGQHPSLRDAVMDAAGARPEIGLKCSGWMARPDLQWNTRVLGLHETAGACLPMFIMYLSVLMYNYHLNSIQRTGSQQEAAARRTAPGGGLMWNVRGWAAAVRQVFVSCGQQVKAAVFELVKVYWTVSQTHEVSKHWLHLHLTWPHPSLTAQATSSPTAQNQLCNKLTQLMLSRRLATSPSSDGAVASTPRTAAATSALPRQDSNGQLAGRQQPSGQAATAAAGTDAGTGSGVGSGGQQGAIGTARSASPSVHMGGASTVQAEKGAIDDVMILPPPAAGRTGSGDAGGVNAGGNGGGTEAGGSVIADEDVRSVAMWPTRWLQHFKVVEASGLRMEHCMVRPDGCTAVMLLEVFPPDIQPWDLPCPTPAAAAAEELQAIAEEQARCEREQQLLHRLHRSHPHHSHQQGAHPQHQRPAAGGGGGGAGPHAGGNLASSASSTTLISAPSEANSAADGSSLGMVVEEMACFEASYHPGTTTTVTTTTSITPDVTTAPTVVATPDPVQGTSSGVQGLSPTTTTTTSQVPVGVEPSGSGHKQAGPVWPGGAPGDEAGQGVTDLGFRLGDVRAHSRNPHDLYTWSLTIDLVAFLYAALFYEAIGNPVSGGVGGLVELGDNTRTLPLAYLAALMALFGLIVAERTVYILGSSTGKLVLHLSSLALVLPWCMIRFWQAPEDSPARHHLRVFLVLRSLSWAMGAQQLMWGYPPLSGTGSQNYRHGLIFYRKPDTWNYIAYQAFAAVPFLYELRTLLDWTCTQTTLDLYTWLKVEDIRGSLYVASARQRMAAGRQPGDPVPRYVKIYQGALILGLLLLVIWLPPLVFSQGAPTYTTPAPTAVSMNMTVTQVALPGGPSSQLSFPLFEAGFSYSTQDWGLLSNGNSSSLAPPPPILPPLLAGYDSNQVQLLCMAQASQSVWLLSPPAKQALVNVLNSTAAALSFSWSVTRSAPLSTGRGAGPGCATSFVVQLSGKSRAELVEVTQGLRSSCVLERLNTSDPDGGAAGHGGYPDLWPLLWRARGETCTLRPGLDIAEAGQDHPAADGGSSRALGSHVMDMDVYSQQSVSCSVSQSSDGLGVSSWWEMSCQVLDSDGLPLANTTHQPQTSCPDTNQGPQVVLILERVQSGFLGATLSSFGITGLYITFVYGIARLLRLSIGNLRLKIPTEDLPSCRRLVTLCQDIYTARAQGELMLEEQLTMCLINIYRSPAVLFELSRRQRSS